MLLAPATAAAQSDAAAAPKATQICLAPVAVEAAPTGLDPVNAVRDAFTSFLTGPSLAVRPPSARSGQDFQPSNVLWSSPASDKKEKTP